MREKTEGTTKRHWKHKLTYTTQINKIGNRYSTKKRCVCGGGGVTSGAHEGQNCYYTLQDTHRVTYKINCHWR